MDQLTKADAAVEYGYVVRPMRVEDCAETALLHVEVWRSAYADLFVSEFLEALDTREFADNWRARVSNGNGSDHHLVAEDPSGKIVGFGSAGSSRDACAPAELELFALNVIAEARGRGVADMLFKELVGGRNCVLWVVKGNDRATNFYNRLGFEFDGNEQWDIASHAFELRMVRSMQGLEDVRHPSESVGVIDGLSGAEH